MVFWWHRLVIQRWQLRQGAVELEEEVGKWGQSAKFALSESLATESAEKQGETKKKMGLGQESFACFIK